MENKNVAKHSEGHRGKKKKKNSDDKIYLVLLLFSLALHIFTMVKYKIGFGIALYPFILIVASVIARRTKNKKLSNMICTIVFVFVCITTVVSAITGK